MDVVHPLYANLLPELLVALVGFPGDVFVPTSSQNGSTYFRLSDVIDWVSPADREVLDTLCRLGALYADLSASLEQAGAGGSLYSQALANGISELLEVYRQAVLQVEQHLLHFPVPPLLTLQQFLADFQVLLPEVHTLVTEVHGRGGMPGSRVMQLLAAKARSGQPVVQSCAQRLFWHCYQVMFKQLESWLVHGLLLDSAGEFFIQQSAALGAASEAQLRQSSPSPLRSASGTGLSPPQDWDPLEWHSGFEVSVSALPPGISLSTADAILFVGKAVRVLKQPIVAAAAAGPGQALQASSEMLGFCEELHQLQQREEFRPAEFDSLVERMRRSVAGLLWTLVLHRSDLLGNLSSLRNYFLLGRGDFYQQFLDEAQPLLQAPPKSSTAEVDIGLVFQQASLKSTADVDPHFSHWHLRWAHPAAGAAAAAATAAASAESEGETAATATATVSGAPTLAELLLALPAWHPAHTANVAVPALDSWDGLYLESVVDWPLQLLLPPEVLSKYGAVWQYLFRLRRVQLSLEGAWSTLQALQHPAAAAADGPRLSPGLRSQLWQLRQRMAHFIHNLEMYIQVDVIDSRFAQLHEAILHAEDFMAADAAHRDYVDSLVIQTFLDVKQLMQIVEAIFDACTRLSKLVQGLARRQTREADAQPLLRDVGNTFRVRMTMLSTLLQSNKLQSANRAPALRQLLLRLNYNNFNSAGVLSAALKPMGAGLQSEGHS